AHMPVPRWWWVGDATPGSRVSALAPPNDEMATFRSSSPAPAKPVPMPAHHRVGLDEHQRRAPVAPDSSESHPKEIGRAPGGGIASFVVGRQLLPQCEVF